jgi:hypothetical protein
VRAFIRRRRYRPGGALVRSAAFAFPLVAAFRPGLFAIVVAVLVAAEARANGFHAAARLAGQSVIACSIFDIRLREALFPVERGFD